MFLNNLIIIENLFNIYIKIILISLFIELDSKTFYLINKTFNSKEDFLINFNVLNNMMLELNKIFIEIIKDFIKLGVILTLYKDKVIIIINREEAGINIYCFFRL